jgi:hypothetical protein
LACIFLSAQNDDASRLSSIPTVKDDSTRVWIIGGGLGVDLGNVLIINPKPGSGQNRFGLGGAIGLFANKQKDRLSWNNNLSLNLGLEKTGSGTLPIANEQIKVPFKKTIDDFRLNSTAGITVREGSKVSYAADLAFRTQFTPAYLGLTDGQVYIKSIDVPGPYENMLVSKFFSPARISFGLGLKYDPNDQLSIVFTPATADLIVIGDQEIANLGIHGTELKDGSTTEYEQTRLGIGAKLGVNYGQKFLNERLTFSSKLALFSDYLHEPKNVDFDWTNELAVTVLKNVQLAFISNLYYDDDILSNVTDFDAVGGLKTDVNGDPILRPTLNYYHQIVLKYTRVF